MRSFDEKAFHALWDSAEDVLELRSRVSDVLAEREIESFDGLGHFLDHVLPDDVGRVGRLNDFLRLPNGALEHLRAGELDPLQLPHETLALVGRLLEVEFDEFVDLAARDHGRFATHADALIARGGPDAEFVVEKLLAAWARFDADSASDL